MSSPLEGKEVELFCTWEVENEKILEDTLTVSVHAVKTECQLENMVNYESCVHLLSTNDSVCELKIKSTLPSNLLAQVCIVSEARILELYGQHGEYLATTRADFIDDFEGLSVFNAVVELPENCTECLLKLIPTKRKEQSIWMYGVNVALEKSTQTKRIDSSVNFENVNKIIKESGHQLTEKAEKCKAFLQQYSSMSVLDPSKFPSKPPDPQVLMRMLQSAYLPQGHGIGEQAKNVSKCLTDLMPAFAQFKAKAEPRAVIHDACPDAMHDGHNAELQALKDHIDKGLVNLETKIMKTLDDRLKDAESRQNSQFEMILARLDSIKKSIELTSKS